MEKSEREGHAFCEFYLQEPKQVLTVTMRDISTCASGWRRREATILKDDDQSILFFLIRKLLLFRKFCFSRETRILEPNPLRLFREICYLTV